ncbi:helix-turn-helix domain-containing protein [Rhodanobacter sp. T12-5]|uniref:helix-turn-helix domain-containing protein n=1 Tax=Rhodanobacter sp. T12-5 TaxID=2024611 RepID=UPI0011ED202C|nr:helix-turn-helix domain-containing protein [Rhodanobacter sp. T12-5]KAA0068305.1 helix-turn-helix domain-containing protein [Rhodanobacter sp. T12-5]
MSEMFAFDSADYAVGEAFERYRDLYAGGSDVERTSDPFFARVRSWRLDRTLLFAREYGGIRHRRKERVASDGFDHFVLHHVVGGTLVGGPYGAAVAIAPGETLLLDTRETMESTARDASLITVSVARDAVRAAAGSLDNLHGRTIGTEEGALLCALLHALVQQAPRLPPGAQPAVTRSLVDLLSVAVNPAGTGARSDFYRLEYVRREAAQRLIELRLADRDFSVQDIVSETGVSRASLYRLFESSGGVARFIQLRRLQHLRDRLDDRAFDACPLAELAPMSGFSGESHAGRQFKQAFGISPGAYRAASIRGAREPSIDLMTRRWSSSLTELN